MESVHIHKEPDFVHYLAVECLEELVTAGLAVAVEQECEKCGTLDHTRLLEVLGLDHDDFAWCNQCQECFDDKPVARLFLDLHCHVHQC